MYMLTLQFDADDMDDFDWLVNFEGELIDNLSPGDEVDGHDLGQGEMNIFIISRDPVCTFNKIQSDFKEFTMRDDFRCAYRLLNSSEYTVLWPKGLMSFSVT